MDVAKFNKELGIKIARAKELERRDNIKAAIELWLAISELALRFSKSRNLDASFRNMIINRTQGIFKHVKNLKTNQLKDKSFIEKIEIPEVIPLVESSLEPGPHKSETLLKTEAQQRKNTEISSTSNDIITNSNFENLPKGFKELKVSEEFKIVTPHDEDYVKKLLSQDNNLNVSTHEKLVETDENLPLGGERFEFDPPDDINNLICFACGYENPLNAKICKNCGISLN